MRAFQVSATVTISLYATIAANSKQEAIAKAKKLVMPQIRDESDNENGDCEEGEPIAWATSGELDGEARDIEAE